MLRYFFTLSTVILFTFQAHSQRSYNDSIIFQDTAHTLIHGCFFDIARSGEKAFWNVVAEKRMGSSNGIFKIQRKDFSAFVVF